MSEMNNYNNQQPINPNSTYDNTPISAWGYFGYQLLFAIPCAGFICLIVFSLGGTKNINLRNFARSYFCFLLIAVIIIAVFLLLGGLAAMTSFSYGF